MTKTDVEDGRVDEEARASAMRSTRRTIPAPRARTQDRRRPRKPARRDRGAGVELTEAGEEQGEEGGRERRPRARSRPLLVRASRVGYSDPPEQPAVRA